MKTTSHKPVYRVSDPDLLEGLSKIRELLNLNLSKLEAISAFELIHNLVKKAYAIGSRHTFTDLTGEHDLIK